MNESGSLVDCLVDNLRRFEKNDKRINKALSLPTKRQVVLALCDLMRKSIRKTVERAEKIIDDKFRV
jgi:hypothetical protein